MRWAWLVLSVLVACGNVSDKPVCTADQLACGTTCIDPLNDNDHCGQCENACTAGLVCGNGQCDDTCPMGQELCDGTCADLQTDMDNCGSCGNACNAAEQECRASSCQVRCDVGLMSPVVDPWGFQWDGLERTAAAVDVATAMCEGFGARLPTASELYRVSANKSGAVGMSFHTNNLWSAAPWDRLNQTVVRLSDAVAVGAAATSSLTYRCVCAPPQPAFFSGTRCNGPAGTECVTVGRYNFDRDDRPAVRHSTAIWECQNEHAHLADFPTVVEAIHAGAPGSNEYIATADQGHYQYANAIRWTSATGWALSGNIALRHLYGAPLAPFRCAGPSFIAGTHSATVPNEFVGQGGMYKGETIDTGARVFSAANDTCFMRGGHLPRSSEHAELIMQGLPGGTNAWLRSSDHAGHDGNGWVASTIRWTGLDKRFPYDNEATGTTTWHYFGDASPSVRCVYYPVDPMWQPPASCTGTCFALNLPTGPGRMIIDGMDRAPALYGVATQVCAAAGGHLASHRDLVEAIRGGLTNGSGMQMMTSDVGQNNVVTSLSWSGIVTTLDGYSSNSWHGPTTVLPYRCMWTNELR